MKNLITSFLGGFCCFLLLKVFTVPEALASTSKELVAESFRMVDKSGRTLILMSSAVEGSPSIWLFDRNNKARLNFGIYEDNKPFVVLNDKNNLAAGIFRLVGKDEPYIILKKDGADKKIMGLNNGVYFER